MKRFFSPHTDSSSPSHGKEPAPPRPEALAPSPKIRKGRGGWAITSLIAKQFITTTFKSKATFMLWMVFALLVAYAASTGYHSYKAQNAMRQEYQHHARESWEANPDKHPHRMAHFGTFAFRTKHPLSLFDFGMESYTGNAVFLEAHKQNSVNFSEASFSTGLLRFGEISMAMLLQLVLPLIIFFIGFGAVATEREGGTLKLLLTQGAGWRPLLFGKTVGLMAVSMVFYLPVILLTAILLGATTDATGDAWARLGIISFMYLLFYWIVAALAVAVSATSRTAKESLIKLLGIWLVFAVLMPRAVQSLGNAFYPSPSRLEFEAAVEADLIKTGDSHNPDDPYYKALKDSVLKANNVDSVQKLPFNYSGLVMQQGERISAELYNQHLAQLNSIYEKQNAVSAATAFINPFTAVRQVSMGLAATDFAAYQQFRDEAEAYRYNLAQRMNELQIKYISNTRPAEGQKPLSISRSNWSDMPDFTYTQLSTASALNGSWPLLLALLLWTALSFLGLVAVSKNAKAI